MLLKRLRIPLSAQLVQQPRRPLHIREQKRHRARGETVSHRPSLAYPRTENMCILCSCSKKDCRFSSRPSSACGSRRRPDWQECRSVRSSARQSMPRRLPNLADRRRAFAAVTAMRGRYLARRSSRPLVTTNETEPLRQRISASKRCDRVFRRRTRDRLRSHRRVLPRVLRRDPVLDQRG